MEKGGRWLIYVYDILVIDVVGSWWLGIGFKLLLMCWWDGDGGIGSVLMGKGEGFSCLIVISGFREGIWCFLFF